MLSDRIPANRGISPRADIRDGDGRDGRPDLVIRANTT
jgi:hypothetical protein